MIARVLPHLALDLRVSVGNSGITRRRVLAETGPYRSIARDLDISVFQINNVRSVLLPLPGQVHVLRVRRRGCFKPGRVS